MYIRNGAASRNERQGSRPRSLAAKRLQQDILAITHVL